MRGAFRLFFYALSFVNPSKIELIKLKIRLKSKAHQKLDTANPGTIASVIMIKIALITKRKSPSVRIVIGIVRIINNGFKIALSKANTNATKMATRKLLIETPGSK